jgi:hypothetical protein
MTTPTHIATSGGLISAAFIENVREPGSWQRGVETASFALPWAEPPKSPVALEGEIATAWELLLERWDAVRADPSAGSGQALPAADRAEFEAIATMCGIGLGTSCYCQAYRDGIARGDPGVPGVGAEALGVKVLPVEGKRPRRGLKKTGDEAKQMRLDLKA